MPKRISELSHRHVTSHIYIGVGFSFWGRGTPSSLLRRYVLAHPGDGTLVDDADPAISTPVGQELDRRPIPSCGDLHWVTASRLQRWLQFLLSRTNQSCSRDLLLRLPRRDFFLF
jgi:hypothetical protein